MKTILHITSSARAEESYSTNLGKEIINLLKVAYPLVTIDTWDLVQTPPPLYTNEMIQSFYISPAQPGYSEINELKYANELLTRLNSADIIVISTPTYNFTVSAQLKAWIDQLVRVGVTYTYNETGNRVGLISNKKVYLAIASGGVQPKGDFVKDYLADYIKDVFKTYVGITDIDTYRIEGTAFPNFSPNYREVLKDFQ